MFCYLKQQISLPPCVRQHHPLAAEGIIEEGEGFAIVLSSATRWNTDPDQTFILA